LGVKRTPRQDVIAKEIETSRLDYVCGIKNRQDGWRKVVNVVNGAEVDLLATESRMTIAVLCIVLEESCEAHRNLSQLQRQALLLLYRARQCALFLEVRFGNAVFLQHIINFWLTQKNIAYAAGHALA